jgi:hypothetical protein
LCGELIRQISKEGGPGRGKRSNGTSLSFTLAISWLELELGGLGLDPLTKAV